MDSTNSFGSPSAASARPIALADMPPRPPLKSKKSSFADLAAINTPGGRDTINVPNAPGELSGNPDLESVAIMGQIEGLMDALSGLQPGMGVLNEEWKAMARQALPQLIAAKQAGSPLGLAAGTQPGMQPPGMMAGMGSSAMGPGAAGSAMPPGGVGGGPQGQ